MVGGMHVSVGMITTDSRNPLPLAHWWADLLGGTITENNGGWFVVVQGPVATLGFQRVEKPTPGKNRVHLDLFTDDLDAALTHARKVGASSVAERREGDTHWFTFADPEGNLFDIAKA